MKKNKNKEHVNKEVNTDQEQKEKESKNKQRKKKKTSKSKFIKIVTFILVSLFLVILLFVYLFITWYKNVFDVYFYDENKDIYHVELNARMKVFDCPKITKEGYIFYGWRNRETNEIFDFSLLIKKEMHFDLVLIDESQFINNLDFSDNIHYKGATDLNGEALVSFLKTLNSEAINNLPKTDRIHRNNTYLNTTYLLFSNQLSKDYIANDETIAYVSLFKDSHLKGFSKEVITNITNERYQLFLKEVSFNYDHVISYGDLENTFEPDDHFKGIISRVLLYMWLYYDAIDINEITYYYNPYKHIISMKTLLTWHFTYDITEYETNFYHETLDSFERTNPFYEYPELVKYIFKDQMIYLGIGI